jgi:hypothetical protein
MLVRLRQVRMEIAARALAEARAATAKAEAARLLADEAAAEADSAQAAARDRLGNDLGEAERLLAVLDQARFRQAVAAQAVEAAQADERARQTAEAGHRRAAIIARARHAGVEERAAALSRRLAQRREERAQADFEDRRQTS